MANFGVSPGRVVVTDLTRRPAHKYGRSVLNFPRSMTPSPRNSRKATVRRLIDTPARKPDVGLSATPETPPENGLVACWEAEAFESPEASEGTTSASEIVAGDQDDISIIDRGEKVSDRELKTVLRVMQNARVQVMNSSDIDKRSKKCLDAMIGAMLDDFSHISEEPFNVDYRVCAKVVLVYSMFAVVFSIFWFRYSGSESFSPGLPPT
ncbi:uncharacterized protein LOC126410107 [Nymphaea colorata]|uniref:uncharacterized protein LOC126410107 n=1 Tax=Nymphaea colorata TaxID=210225 RepID=UPI00214E284D|nr:uncharacterized protein LOC126410107 [Nymphaea colorata]